MSSNHTKKALFLDRDGVINIDTAYTHKIDDITFIEGIFELANFALDKNYKLFIITNHAGIGRGLYTEAQYQIAKNYIEDNFRKNGSSITKTYHCPNHPEFGIGKYKIESAFRKPNPGMIIKAREEFGIDLANSIIVGDRESDIEAGINAGIKTKILFRPKYPNEKTKADFVVYNLLKIKEYL